jgi:hypothetical protein
MRRLGVSLLVVMALSPAAAQQPTGAPTASTVLAAAREALGGEKRLAAVRSIVANGRTRQVQGNNLVPIEFEISIELPNKYIRRDEIPARDTGPTTTGFNGPELVLSPAPPPPPPGFKGPPPEAVRQTRLVTARQDFARLALGMFAASFDAYPLTFVHVGEAEAPQGKADVLEVKGPANFTAQLFVHKDTHLPVMVGWKPPSQGRAQGQPVEMRLYYADYRPVDGMMFPFRLRRAVGPDTVEETTFDRYRVNVRIEPRKFEVPK